MESLKSRTCKEPGTLQIVRHPDRILRTKAKEVERITTEIFGLADTMTELMLKCDGVGLAANQVGKLWRVCVINTTPGEDKPNPIVIINPQIIRSEGLSVDEEGCLSLPGLFLNIPRAERILVQMQNLYNEKIVYEAEGLLSRALQHEIDHLNAVLFIDYVGEQEKAKVKDYLERLT